jgi:uncharacterized protein
VKRLFADTFYFLALLHVDDNAHSRAVGSSETSSAPLLTTAWVLTEMADALAMPRMRETFTRFLTALRGNPAYMIVPPTQALFDQGVELYAKRPDKDWSLTDCISFVVMRDQGITQALTGDHHFEQAGFMAPLK